MGLIPQKLQELVRQRKEGRRMINGVQHYWCCKCDNWREGVTTGDDEGWETVCEKCDLILDED